MQKFWILKLEPCSEPLHITGEISSQHHPMPPANTDTPPPGTDSLRCHARAETHQAESLTATTPNHSHPHAPPTPPFAWALAPRFSGFGVWGWGFEVWGLEFGVWGLESRVYGFGCCDRAARGRRATLNPQPPTPKFRTPHPTPHTTHPTPHTPNLRKRGR